MSVREKTSEDCPIVVISGIFGPTNSSWCEMYWGEAMKLGTKASPVLALPVASLGSAHDRACEMFAQLRGCKVDYGKAHSEKFGHDQFGTDYTGQAMFPEWSAERPIHLVGHSFGGNTVRAFIYLVAIDFFNVGTSAAWVRSTTTLCSPLHGSLLTYKMGHKESHCTKMPVRFFSVVNFVGLGMHAYELVCRKTGLDQYLDIGMRHWGLERAGWKQFFKSVAHGCTTAAQARDNASQDLTIQDALEWLDRLGSLPKSAGSQHFEFNFVANTRDLLHVNPIARLWRRDGRINESYSDPNPQDGRACYQLRTDVEVKNLEPELEQVAEDTVVVNESRSWRALVFMRDLGLHMAARYAHSLSYALAFEKKHHSEAICVKTFLESGTDGLCNVHSQYQSEHVLREEELVPQKDRLAPGQYTVLMSEHHSHFSIVPFPDSTSDQRMFFQQLFTSLRGLRV